MKIDAADIHYRELNRLLREAVSGSARRLELHNVFGQRYIGTNLAGRARIDIYGTPGNDLGAFMDGPTIVVHGNAQDGCGNTMNEGKIVVEGRAGDITGLAARGGKIFIRDDVGYRAGIHMKQYDGKRPLLVIGGTAQDFLGEYMAGGVIVVLGLTLHPGERHKANLVGTGMHGGVIYVRGPLDRRQLGEGVQVGRPEGKERLLLARLVGEFARHFGCDAQEIMAGDFVKLTPVSLRPYGDLYAH
jgi:glutamate synthase domain-containing protein 3